MTGKYTRIQNRLRISQVKRNLISDRPNFLLKDHVLRKQKADEIEAILGKGHIEQAYAHYYVLFDINTPNIELCGGIHLHDFLPRMDRDRYSSRLDVKIILFLERLVEEFEKRHRFPADKSTVIRVRSGYKHILDNRIRDSEERFATALGSVAEFELSSRSPYVLKEFHKAVRRVRFYGYIKFDGRRILVNAFTVKKRVYV